MNGQLKDKARVQSQDNRGKITIIIFLIIEAVLYITFTGMDLFAPNQMTTVLKYSSIFICLIFSFYCFAKYKERIVPFALFCTAMADLFLLVINGYYLAGLLFFILAQTLYMVRLYLEKGELWLPTRIVCALAAVLILFIVKMISPVNLAAVLYFSLLLVNMALSWRIKGRKWRIFAIGLSFFVLCDLCVGIFNLGSIMPDELYRFSGIGMWLFYLPSQVLIALSGIK